MTLAARTSCLARHLVRAASKPMRSPRGVTLASVQLSSLPDASSPAPLPEQRERGNRRTHVLPLSPYVRPCVVISCQSILSHAPIKTSHNWTLVSFRGQRGKDGEHQPDDLKRSIYDSKHSICDLKHSFWQPDDSKHFFLRLLCRRSKKS